ncbi:MAG TPA: DUF2306 domain-containing protein [Terriglobales bacterium]|nr:DUF2306 domain-containing protein [Terriglobales bacterium]
MATSPILIVHICGGSLALVSGAAAMSFRKGSRWHRTAGNVFVLCMLTMATTAIYIAALKHESGNVSGGILTWYLVATAWLTARRRNGSTSKYDLVLLLIPLVLGSLTIISGVEKLRIPGPPKDGVPAGINFFLGSVMLLAGAGDVRMLARGGISGSKRIARHLWRMCFGFFIATGSFFLGPANRPLRLLSAIGLRQQIFRTLLRQELLFFLAILPLLLLIFWMIRVKVMKSYDKKALQPRDIYKIDLDSAKLQTD